MILFTLLWSNHTGMPPGAMNTAIPSRNTTDRGASTSNRLPPFNSTVKRRNGRRDISDSNIRSKFSAVMIHHSLLRGRRALQGELKRRARRPGDRERPQRARLQLQRDHLLLAALREDSRGAAILRVVAPPQE